jgi:hypothetical protein
MSKKIPKNSISNNSYDPFSSELDILEKKFKEEERAAGAEKAGAFVAGVIIAILISAITAAFLMLIIDVFHHRSITSGSLGYWDALKIIIFARAAWMVERAFNRSAR